MQEEIKFCRGGGCTAKLGSAVLSKILEKLPKPTDPKLLIGTESSDDAAVYKLTDELAMVQTVDFFPPMVDDPYIFGQIAAANALSDVYAMGSKPVTALNLVCFPENWDMNILGKILQGGQQKVIEAGASLVGGHSIADSEVKYGLSVTGLINPDKVRANNTAHAGDKLILTKPLGVGLTCTAARAGEQINSLDEAIKSMTTLNKYAAEVADEFEIHACTDVTGFGLVGHLNEMLRPDLSARIYAKNLPKISNVRYFAEEFYLTAAAQRNRNAAEGKIKFIKSDFATEELVFDPQTSGGLLFALSASEADLLQQKLINLGLNSAIIGEIMPRMDVEIIIEGKI